MYDINLQTEEFCQFVEHLNMYVSIYWFNCVYLLIRRALLNYNLMVEPEFQLTNFIGKIHYREFYLPNEN